MVSITEIQNKEKSQISKILKDYWKERSIKRTQKDIIKYIEKGLDIDEYKFFTIRNDKKIIGNLTILIRGDLAELRDIFVKKEYRRKGLGKEMMNFAILYCKSRNIRKLFSLILKEYQHFFKRLGFEEEGILNNHYREGENLIVMSKFLEMEKQLSLKEQVQKLDISMITSQQLQKLRY